MADSTPSAGRLGRTVGAGAAVGATMLAYGFLEAHWYRLRHLHLTGVTAPGAPPLRILHLSDLHLSPLHRRVGDFLAGLAQEDYDLVVATGDLLGDRDMEEQVVGMLAPLTADGRPGVAVLGSNDFWAPVPRNPFTYFTSPSEVQRHGVVLDAEALVAGLARTGWTTLRNTADTVTVRGGVIAISAIDDPHDPRTRLPDVATITPPSGPALLRLGLVHAPYLAALDRLVDAGAQLLLAGHTHGGQVRVPGIGALVDNCDLPLDQARGASTHRGVPLHVSVGLGTSKYAPVRFACRPEATLLTLLP